MLHVMSRNFICGSLELVCGSWPIQSHGGVWYCLERDSTQIMHLDAVLRNQTLTDTCVGKIFWQSSVLGTRYQHTWTLYMYTSAVKSTTNLWLTVSAENALLSRVKTGLQIIQVLSGSDIPRCVKTVYKNAIQYTLSVIVKIIRAWGKCAGAIALRITGYDNHNYGSVLAWSTLMREVLGLTPCGRLCFLFCQQQ